MTSSSRWRILVCSLTLLGLAACSAEITGPSPSFSGDPGADTPEDSTTWPGFTCNEQLDRWIEVRGSDFSPLVVDAIATEEDFRVVLPTVTLTWVSTPEGEAGDQEVEVVLKATDDETTQVKWIEDGLMQFRITPDLELIPGVYDVTVSNENGESSTAEGAFGLMPRPTVTAVREDLQCVAQGERPLTVSGDHLLVRSDETPTVQIGEQTYTVDAASDCRDLAATFGSYQFCQTLDITIAEGDFEPGEFAVGIQNIAPADCASDVPGDAVNFYVVPPPTVADIQPEPICSEQLGYDPMTVTGEGFLKITVEGEERLPSITVGEMTFEGTSVDGCTAIPGPVHQDAEMCTSVTFVSAAGDIPAGEQPVTVDNPLPAGCTSTEDVGLTVLPPPTLTAIDPQPICTEQGDNVMTVTGTGFATIDGVQPTVTIGESTYDATASDCTAVEGPAITVESCTTLEVTVPQGDLAESGVYAVSVTNPDDAGCTTTEQVDLTVVPPPTLTSVAPVYLCAETTTATLELTGEGFLQIDDELPTVIFGDQMLPAATIDGCEGVEGVDTAMTCTTLTVEVPEGIAEGAVATAVVNPAPAGCMSTEDVAVQALGAPTVTAVDPTLFCAADGGTEVTVTGTNLFSVDDALPTVTLGESTYDATAVDGCEAVEMTGDDTVQRCTSLTVTVPSDLGTDSYDVVVTNPAPVACSNADPSGVQTIVAGGPVAESYNPPVICRGQFDGELTINGTGFFEIDGASPTVQLAGGVDVTVNELLGCEAVPGVDDVQSCTGIGVTIPDGSRDMALSIDVTNPAPADCETSTLEVDLEEPPRVDDVQPRKICDEGGSLTLTGDFFQDGMTVTLDDVEAVTVDVTSAQEAVATWDGPLTPGLATLTAQNPTGCFDTFETEIRVTEGPIVFFVDPPVVYNGISIRATMYLGNLYGGSVEQVIITDEDDMDTELDFAFDPARPNRLQATIPAGLTAGSYDVTMIDEVDCPGTTEDLLQVTDEVVVSVAEVFPPFGNTDEPTGIVVQTEDPVPADEEAFQPTPRVYLNPSDPQPGDIAQELSATTLLSPNELNGIVDEGLPPNTYDIIVVNPDGTVGLLEGQFIIPAEAPPLVDTLSPGTWETGDGALDVTISGENFRTPMVTTECQAGGAAANPIPITVVGGDGSTINVTADTGATANNAVCVLTVTNDDGTFATFSPVTLVNPFGKFVDFLQTDRTLATPTRAPILASGAPSRTSRFLYAFGGDDGTADTARDTAQYATIDRFGQPSDFADMPAPLGFNRTLTRAVRIDDFIYIAGGHDGTMPVAGVMRAQILDPLDVPVISNLDFNFVEDSDNEVGPGVYYYRVTAVLPDDNAWNPGGETLASNPQPVSVPDLEVPVHIQLEWDELPYAVESYRVYRSPSPDLTFGQEELMAEIPGDETIFVDDGTFTFDAAQVPLPVGALGNWHMVADLDTARYSHGTAVATDPADPTVKHIYVGGGEDGTDALASVERITVTVNGPRDQVVTDAAPAGMLSSGRSEIELLVADPTNSSRLEDMGDTFTYVYALSGYNTAGTIDTNVDIAAVMDGGGLATAFGVENSLTGGGGRAGYASTIANNSLLATGGAGGNPDNTGRLSVIEDTAGTLGNWTSLSAINARPRYLAGRLTFGGFFYVLGGVESAPDTLSDTLDISILGGVP